MCSPLPASPSSAPVPPPARTCPRRWAGSVLLPCSVGRLFASSARASPQYPQTPGRQTAGRDVGLHTRPAASWFFLPLLQNRVPRRSRGCWHPPARLPGWAVGSLSLTWLLRRLAPLASWAWLSARLLNRQGEVSGEWGHHSPGQGARAQALTGFKGPEPRQNRPSPARAPLWQGGVSMLAGEKANVGERGGPCGQGGRSGEVQWPSRRWGEGFGPGGVGFQGVGHVVSRVGRFVSRVQGTRQMHSFAHLNK